MERKRLFGELKILNPELSQWRNKRQEPIGD